MTSAEAQARQIARAVGGKVFRESSESCWVVVPRYKGLRELSCMRQVLVSTEQGVTLVHAPRDPKAQAAATWCVATRAIEWLRAEQQWPRRLWRWFRWGV